MKIKLVSFSLYVVGVFVLLLFILHRNGGHFSYVLDDAYIHMVVAKNYVKYGVFGITKYGFTSSLSSIVWPWILIASFKIFGVNEFLPLILNVFLSLFVILFSFWALSQHRAFLFSFSSIFFGSLLSLTFTGLEHNLHILSTLFLFSVATEMVKKWKNPLLFAASLLTTASRYEGIAAVLLLSLYRFYKRDLLGGFLILLGGSIPILAYGFWSEAHGWYFLPTSVLLKSYRFDLSSVGGWADLLFLRFLSVSLRHPVFYTLLILLLTSLIISRETHKREVLILSLGILLAHMYFGSVGWFFRYEAYAVVLTLFALFYSLNWEFIEGFWVRSDILRKIACIALSFLLLLPLLMRGYKAVAYVPRASNDIYEQDYQISLFIKRYYDGDVVVLNDVGNVAFYTDAKILDLWGLATLETARMLLEGRYTWDSVDSLVKSEGGKIAILYGEVFSKRYFQIRWEVVGFWHLRGKRIVTGSQTVYFYSILEDINRLKENFTSFSSEHLPNDIQYGIYDPSE